MPTTAQTCAIGIIAKDLELLQITGSLRGRAKSSRPRRQAKNARRRGLLHIENVFGRQRRHSGFAAGRNRAGYLDTLSFMQNKPNFRKSQMNVSIFSQKAYENKCNWTFGENKPNQTQFQPKNEPNKPNFYTNYAKQTQTNPILSQRLRGYEWLARKGRNSFYARRHAATYSQNMYHRKNRSGAAQSKYKGIYWRKKNRKWQARITFERKRINLGYFRNEIDTAKACDRAAMKYHGEFATLNLPKTA